MWVANNLVYVQYDNQLDFYIDQELVTVSNIRCLYKYDGGR